MPGPTTPIQHVIVIVGENHTFDNVFGAYRPRGGRKVLNLRSQGIITGDGQPGPSFAAARQKTANPGGTYSINPTRTGTYAHLPQPDTTYATGLPGSKLTRAIPIIAVTAFALQGDEAKVIASGCDAYVPKPLNVAEFVGTVARYTRQARRS
jgi:CheY-like chemotaxis protein